MVCRSSLKFVAVNKINTQKTKMMKSVVLLFSLELSMNQFSKYLDDVTVV